MIRSMMFMGINWILYLDIYLTILPPFHVCHSNVIRDIYNICKNKQADLKVIFGAMMLLGMGWTSSTLGFSQWIHKLQL
jgi:hypothetical protein